MRTFQTINYCRYSEPAVTVQTEDPLHVTISNATGKTGYADEMSAAHLCLFNGEVSLKGMSIQHKPS